MSCMQIVTSLESVTLSVPIFDRCCADCPQCFFFFDTAADVMVGWEMMAEENEIDNNCSIYPWSYKARVS